MSHEFWWGLFYGVIFSLALYFMIALWLFM